MSLIYYRIYRTTKSPFSLWLTIMSIAFFLFVMSSSPLIYLLIGRKKFLGVFEFFGDGFTTIATVVLIYLSRQ